MTAAINPEEAALARQYDLCPRMVDFLDRHLLYPILESLAGTVYKDSEIDELEFNLLKDTYMTKFLKEIISNNKIENFNVDENFLKNLNEKEVNIVNKLHKLNESTDKTLEILRSDEIHNNLKSDKNLNIKLLENFGINNDKILELFEFGKLLFNRGEYEMASDLLNNFKILSIDENLIFKATLGKFICDLMNQDFNDAKNEMIQIREIIDNRYFKGSSIEQLKLRNWLIHNSLFIFFDINNTNTSANSSNGDNTIPEENEDNSNSNNNSNSNSNSNNSSKNNNLSLMNEIFLSSSYLSTIEASCPWILRYLVVSIIYLKDYKKLKDLIRAIEIESYEYNDPFTLLIKSLFIDFKFNNIKETLTEIKTICKFDFFIKNVNQDILFKNIVEIILKNLLKVFKNLSIKQINKAFIDDSNNDLINEIVNNSNIFKMDSDNLISLVIDEKNSDLYFQTYEKTKALSFKSNQFLNNAVHKDI